jgi:glycosyltransferase involved in cell wall biosynthesis
LKNSPAKRPVVFYFPYPSVGGVSVLFLRLAKLLCKQRRIILMDLENGYMAKHRPKNVEFILYSEPEMLPENSIVVFQSVPPWRIPFIAKFPKKATIFFWNLHPDNLRPDFIGIGSKFKGINLLFYPFTAIRKRKLNKLIKLLLKNNAIRFMDKENLLSTASFYNIDGDRLFLSADIN